MKAREPLRYEVGVTRRGALDATVEAAPRPAIGGGPPPEFGGGERAWSPEHLLVASAALCYWNTLEWFARRKAVPVLGFECRAEGEVEKSAGGLAFTRIRLDVAVTTTEPSVPLLHDLLHTAKQSCLVARSLACPVELVADVKAEVAGGAIAC
jgi:organic hydroperoxide reductase OsmC/OhrA